MDELGALHESVTRSLGPALGPEDGDVAFERHKLLAARIHQAAGLAQTGKGDGQGWIQYLTGYFPAGRRGEADAKLLWDEWRCPLLKEGRPGTGVSITHVQPHLHWKRERGGGLCIDLESMWADFEYSVDGLVAFLKAEPGRAKIVLERWRKQSWTVRPFEPELRPEDLERLDIRPFPAISGSPTVMAPQHYRKV
jgi:hypothetical protein